MHYKPPTFNALFPEPWMRKKHEFNALVCYLGSNLLDISKRQRWTEVGSSATRERTAIPLKQQ